MKSFRIIETVLYDSVPVNIKAHLARMEKSAKYFNFDYDERKIYRILEELKEKYPEGIFKLRILLSKNGYIRIEKKAIGEFADERAVISDKKTDPGNVFLYHKTTNRNLYARELKRVRKSGYYDVLFFNKKWQLTEGAISNVYIKEEESIYTPELECGLLNGTVRRNLVKSGEVKEKNIFYEDLLSADEVYVSNSIIGLKKISLEKP